MRIAPLVCTALALAAASAAAQDPAKVASANYKVLAENERIRVLGVTMAPGAKAVMHEHPAHVAVAMSTCTVQMTLKDGKSSSTEMKPDMVTQLPAGAHATSNPGTTTAEVFVIEMKGAPGTATLPSARPGMKMTPLLQDARVMAYRVAFDPSFHEAAGTTHDYDQVVIPLGAGDTSLTIDGKTKSAWKRGEVQLIGRGVPHETQMGKQAGDMIIVAVK